MGIPALSLTVKSKSLGLSKGSTDNLAILIGASSKGTAKTRYSFTDIKTLTDTLGLGPLVEAAAYVLQNGGGPVLCMPINASVVGVAGAVTHVGTGIPTVSVSAGTPVDGFDVLITITTGGALGAGQFTYSLDGGLTTSAPIVIPSGGSYVLSDTGLTLTFAAGTYVKGDTYESVCTAPSFVLADATAAVDAAIALADDFSLLYLVGELGTAAGAEGVAAAIDAKLATAESTQYRYITGIVECPWDKVTNTDSVDAAAFAADDLEHTVVGVGHATMTSPVNGRRLQRNAAFLAVARAVSVAVQTDLARFADGPLPNVAAIDRDEYKSQALDADRFTTLRTWPGQTGFYLTNGRLMAVAGSDFTFIQYRRVMNKALVATRDALLQFMNETLQVNADGTLTEKQARTIEHAVERAVDVSVVHKGGAEGVAAAVDRTENVLSTQNITVTIQLDGLAYAKTITATVGFTNPALSATT